MIERFMNYKGYPAFVVFQKTGYRRGVIGIPKGDFLYGIDLTDPAFNKYEVPVHGGINTCSFTFGPYEETKPKSQYWWIGFSADTEEDNIDIGGLMDYYNIDLDSIKFQTYAKKYKENDGREVRSLNFMLGELKAGIDYIITINEGMRDVKKN